MTSNQGTTIDNTNTAIESDGLPAVGTPEERQREKDKAFLNQMSQDDMNGFAILGILLEIFFGIKGKNGESLVGDQALDNIASALGLENSQFRESVSRLRSGETTIYETVTSTIKDINPATADWSRARAAVPPPKVASIGEIQIGERQQTVVDTIPDAAKAVGIDPDFMRGLWGIESSFGQNLMSPTGCEGDWQFSQGTWDSIMKKDGAKIADLIEAEYPLKAMEIRQNHQNRGSLNEYQYDPVVSTYASAFLTQRNAVSMGVDPMQRESWSVLYAAYNIGAGNAKELQAIEASGSQRAVMNEIGSAARHNPLFFKNNASAGDALARYQSVIETRLEDYDKQLAHLERPTITLASVETPLTKAFDGQGVETNDPQQPDPLTGAFDGQGVDEVALAAARDSVQTTQEATLTTNAPAAAS